MDLTPVWKQLTTNNVLLLIDTHHEPDPSVEHPTMYDADFFDSRVKEVVAWFGKGIRYSLSSVDFELSNNAVLSVRPLIRLPFTPRPTPNVVIMVL